MGSLRGSLLGDSTGRLAWEGSQLIVSSGAFLNPIPPGGGLFDPLYHESVCCIYRTRTRFTKHHDFVPFGICQDPAKLFPTFFSKKFEIFDVEIFWGSSSIGKN